ncbi:SRPBCC domain-containing protein [Pedobacter frigoris]|uniref:SRPBCC family protein n=1 Tax=Pedobacter frigoris TaxID=2571272 RepID=UPI00292F86F3|nr:SRPBCC domain-containing protein [Pedobacter frigoris]
MKTDPFVIERTFTAPIPAVWQAITDPGQMKEWYFDLEDFKPEAGFKFQFLAGSEQKKYLHICKVTEVREGSKLTYSWQYDNYEGQSWVTFELFDAGDGKTRVKLTHTGLGSFPSKDDPAFSKQSFADGWTYIIGTSLKEYLEKE